MEEQFDFKNLVSARCFSKYITSKIKINTPVISFCKSNVVVWQKNQLYEIVQFFQSYFELWLILFSVGILTGLMKKFLNEGRDSFLKWRTTSSIQQVMGSIERMPVHFYLDENLKMFVSVCAASVISQLSSTF